MAYHPEVMRETRQKHKEKVRDFNEKEESKKVALLERSPSLKQLNDQLDKLSFRMAYSALMGNPQEIQNIRKDAEAIHEKQGEILAEMGEAKDALRPHYMCAKCEDAGSTGEADCDCLLEAYREGLIEHYAMY